ncbi:hypothetical protein A5714_10780 [Mycobacterium sp. E2462]|uniref:DUF4407 domain-containing protein n=1 Tax=Mycobacterium sp. E2462 TaxID=1834133 RepID=UPI0007FD9EF6|nr:DUF4407 domain-containing protein [Mycobacterium sp. E2462]OBI16952.1 hypothetical protein A5714_10780 [Mycobacterium sp. E2462]
MSAQETTVRRRAATPAAVLGWLGGGPEAEPGGHRERSAHAVAGAVVLLGAVWAGVVAGLVGATALAGTAGWSVPAIAVLAGLLVGAVARGTLVGGHRSRTTTAARAAAAGALGVVVGEFALLALLSGAIDRRIDERAAREGDATPAVMQAAAALQRDRDARRALDADVDAARERQDQALVTARCEYHPSPSCPQTRITGIPGAGPETRTANDLLADAQQQLDAALTARDARAPQLDAELARAQRELDEARRRAVAKPGLGARWLALNDVTLAGPGPLTLRVAVDASCVLLYALPMIVASWRGETTRERRATALLRRDCAELEADTAIAIKRAEVRREAEILWAEHQLTQARLAIEAQLEIDREHQRRRVADALEPRASAQRIVEPTDDDVYLPIAAAAEAASRAVAPPPAEPAAVTMDAPLPAPQHLPAVPSPANEVEQHTPRVTPLIPSIPDVTKVAARWLRPLVPPLVTRVVDSTTHPWRTARHVVEEVLEETEEITFALRRTRKVRVSSDLTSSDAAHPPADEAPADAPPTTPTRVASARAGGPSLRGRAGGNAALESDDRRTVSRRPGPPEIEPPGDPRAPRSLPPAD